MELEQVSLAFLSSEYLIFMISLILVMPFFVSREYNANHCFVQNIIFGKIQIEKYVILLSSKKLNFHVWEIPTKVIQDTFSTSVEYLVF